MPPAAQPANPKPPHARASARLVATVGATIGLCIMGDSLMYSILPLHTPALGFTLPMVGILLSANRLVRLLSNKWAGDIFERWGARVPFLGAVILGLFSTASYGVSAGFLVFLLARMAWGVAWSGLRQGGYAALWTGGGGARGRLTGLLWGLVRLGSAVGVFAGGLLYDRRGYGAAIAAILAAGLFALPVALAARWPAGDKAQSGIPSAEGDEAPLETAAPATWRQLAEAALQAPLQRWLTLASFFAYLLSGIIVSTTSVFLAARFGSGAGAIFFGLGVAALTGLLHSRALAYRPAARPARGLALGLCRPSQYAGRARRLDAAGLAGRVDAAGCGCGCLSLRRAAAGQFHLRRHQRRGEQRGPTRRATACLRSGLRHHLRCRRRARPPHRLQHRSQRRAPAPRLPHRSRRPLLGAAAIPARRPRGGCDYPFRVD